MRGTVVCAVTDSEEGRRGLAVAAALSERLDLRLVLVHVADRIPPVGRSGDERVTSRAAREGAARLLARLAAEQGVEEPAEQRPAVGDPARLLGQIAAEEAADMIVVGSRPRGRLRRSVDSAFLRRLETETAVPILIAWPPARHGSEFGR